MKDTDLKEKRVILPEYRKNMKEKIGEYTFDTYEEKVKAVAILLLELNADLLTEEQRSKLGIEAFKLMDELTVKDKISSVIDSEEFNLACRIEDEFAYDETEELLNVISYFIENSAPYIFYAIATWAIGYSINKLNFIANNIVIENNVDSIEDIVIEETSEVMPVEEVQTIEEEIVTVEDSNIDENNIDENNIDENK